MSKIFQLIISIQVMISLSAGQGTWSYPGCDDVTDADFEQVVLVGKSDALSPLLVDATLEEPIEMVLTDDGEGGADIYFTERRGKLKFYDASLNTVSEVGEVNAAWQTPADGNQDAGFMGIALDNDFASNRRLYVSYANHDNGGNLRISRITLAGNNTFASNAESVMLEISMDLSIQWHTSGSMSMDAYGDLWVAVGKNCTDYGGSVDESNEAKSCENSASDTHDLRGGVIRIHPEEDGTYTIPQGNFGDYFGHQYESEGDAARAAEFRDTSLVRPEVYAKGLRNPFTLTLEPVKRWLIWGENGVNTGQMHEEHNLTTVPGFFGYPYFAGDPILTGPYQLGYNPPLDLNPEAPENNSQWNTGLTVLPPTTPAIHTYSQSSAITGPLYRYDGDLVSEVKFPPHFNGKWFVFDFNRGNRGGAQDRGVTKVLELDESGGEIIASQDIFQPPAHNIYGTLDIEMGPDGAMYILNYAGWFDTHELTSIVRMEYTGNCHPAEPRLEENVNPNVYYPSAGYGCTDVTDAHYDAAAYASDPLACASALGMTEDSHGGVNPGVRITSNGIFITDPARHRVKLLSLQGKSLKTFYGTGAAHYPLRGLSGTGVYVIQVETSAGRVQKKTVIQREL